MTNSLWKLQRLRKSPRFSEADGDPREWRKLQWEELHVTGNSQTPDGSADGQDGQSYMDSCRDWKRNRCH